MFLLCPMRILQYNRTAKQITLYTISEQNIILKYVQKLYYR